MNRKLAVGIVTAISVVGMAVPAFAEGSFTSSLSGVHVGFESRRWVDKNSDNVNTSIYFSSCNRSTNVKVKADVFGPDPVMGEGNPCGSTKYYGDLPSNDYYFVISSISGSTGSTYTLNVPSLTVKY